MRRLLFTQLSLEDLTSLVDLVEVDGECALPTAAVLVSTPVGVGWTAGTWSR